MNKKGNIPLEAAILLVVAITLVFMGIFIPDYYERVRESNIRTESFKIGKIISETPPGTCEEENLRLYWWFRSQGYIPLVQVGKKNGEGHLWLEWNDRIYDATDWNYNDKKVEAAKAYKRADYEFEYIK